MIKNVGIFRLSKFNLAIYIFIISLLFSGLGSSYYFVSLAKAIYYFITGTLIYYLIILVGLSRKRVRNLLNYLIILSFIVSFYGILTFFLGEDFLFNKVYFHGTVFFNSQFYNLKQGRILSLLGHSDFTGSYLAMFSPLFLFSFYFCQSKYKKIIIWVFYITVVYTIILTFSGGAYLAFLFTNFILLIVLKRKLQINNIFFFSFLFPIIITSLLFVLLFLSIITTQNKELIYSVLNTLFFDRVNFKEIISFESISRRVDSINICWGYWAKNNFINGLGIGKISRMVKKTALDNLYLTILVDSGLVGIIAFLFLDFTVLTKMLSDYINLHSKEDKVIVISLFMCIVAFLIDSFYWDTFYHPTLRMFFWLIIAIFMVMRENYLTSFKNRFGKA